MVLTVHFSVFVSSSSPVPPPRSSNSSANNWGENRNLRWWSGPNKGLTAAAQVCYKVKSAVHMHNILLEDDRTMEEIPALHREEVTHSINVAIEAMGILLEATESPQGCAKVSGFGLRG
eukprot:366822-Prorocentrum_minimum.AAC.1